MTSPLPKADLDASQALADIERTEAGAVAYVRARADADLVTVFGLFWCGVAALVIVHAALAKAHSPTWALTLLIVQVPVYILAYLVLQRLRQRRPLLTDRLRSKGIGIHASNAFWLGGVPLWIALNACATTAAMRAFPAHGQGLFSMTTGVVGTVTILTGVSLFVYRTRLGLIVFVAATAIACAVAIWGPTDPRPRDFAASIPIVLTMLGLGLYSRHALKRGWPSL